MPSPEQDANSWLAKLMQPLETNFRNLSNTLESLNRITGSFEDITQTFTAAQALSAGDLCCLDSSGEMDLADASSITLSGSLLAVATQTIASGAEGSFLLRGTVTTSGLTAGAAQYVSETAGDFTETAPTTGGTVVRVAGFALSGTSLHFDPSNNWTVN